MVYSYDEKNKQVKQYAKDQGISLNKLFDEFATKTRFSFMSQKGDVKEGLKLLDKLDDNLSLILSSPVPNATVFKSPFL